MNRQIKFRGKSVDNGEWLYGNLIQRIGRFSGIMFDYEHGGKIYYAEQPVDPDTVGQFTGLHDRTGKEVYEGDVVFWITIDMRGRGKGEQGAIIWDNPTMSWAIMRDKPTSDGRPCIISRPFDKKHLEVVGTIHDNPELLEKAKN